MHILLNLTRISDVSRELLVFSFCLFYIKQQASLRWALTDLGHPCMAVGLGSDPSLPSGSMVLSRHTWEELKLKRRNLSKQLNLPKGIQFWLLCNFYLQSLFTSPGRMTGDLLQGGVTPWKQIWDSSSLGLTHKRRQQAQARDDATHSRPQWKRQTCTLSNTAQGPGVRDTYCVRSANRFLRHEEMGKTGKRKHPECYHAGLRTAVWPLRNYSTSVSTKHGYTMYHLLHILLDKLN